MFSNFSFTRYSFLLRAEDCLSLPLFKGAAIRGGFGYAFKKVVCAVKRNTCDECLLKSRCVYSYIFETAPPEGSAALRNYKNIPHPFIIEPPVETKTQYESGDTLSFNLILIGKACEYLPYFVYAFEELGRMGIGRGRGRYILSEMTEVAASGDAVIYSEKDRRLATGGLRQSGKDYLAMMLRANGENTNSVAFNFITPARIVVNDDLVVNLTFHQFIRSLLRRIANLSYFHCGDAVDIDFKGLIERAGRIKASSNRLEWRDWKRYSGRQKVEMNMGGFAGEIVFEGDVKEFIPYIRLGEIVHVGKGTAFGLGRYAALLT